MSEVKVNRCYKDRMFVRLFGNPVYAQNALELYNAVNGIRHKAEVMDVVLTEYDEAKHMKRIEQEAEERGQIKGAIKLARMTPDLSDQDIVSKLVNLFALSEDEAWEYVRGCK